MGFYLTIGPFSSIFIHGDDFNESKTRNFGKHIKKGKESVWIIMYCDFCGKKLSYYAKYCRHCGQQLKDSLGDTQPLPIVSAAMLHTVKRQALDITPWYKSIFPKKPLRNRSKVWRILYDLFSLAAFVALLYIFTTFQTIEEYQSLTGLWAGILAIYIWWKR